MQGERLSLYELNNLVRRSLECCLPDAYWVQAELSDVRVNASGHCYMELVQKDPRGNSLVAKARATIWSNNYLLLRGYFEKETGQLFVSGIKVLLKVSVQFHELYGYNLIVQDIDPAYTLGDMVLRRKEILKQLEDEGVLTLNKELELPVLTQRIAVVSSATAAGYGDFCHQLQHNAGGFYFYTELFPAVMQGDRIEDSLLAALDKINDRRGEFDAVVIIRGGGATSDLSGFDTYLLAAACAQFPLPVITGIGHERDDTVLDAVAHTRVKTPTAAAELLIHRLADEAERIRQCALRLREGVFGRLSWEEERLERLSARVKESSLRRLSEEHDRLRVCRTRIPRAVSKRLSDARVEVLSAQKDLIRAVSGLLSGKRHRLELLAQRVSDASPERLLKRGYSLTLHNGKVITDAAQVKKGDRLTTRLAGGEVQSIVK